MNYYRKQIIREISIFLFVISLIACTKPDIEFGASYLDNTNTNIIYNDTFSTSLSTVLIDSVVTSNTGSAVIGSYVDPYFGTVSAESYFPINAPAYANQYQNALYDSIVIILKPNKKYYGDTTKPMKISVQELSEKIELGDSRTQFYNTSFFAAASAVLGSKTFSIRPSIDDSLVIKLSDVLGADLFNKLKNADEIIQTQEKFREYFKGLKISASQSFILGFSDSVAMRIYYHENAIYPNSQSVDFTLSDASLQFNHINTNRAGTVLSSLNSINNELPSSATGNASYLQSATGTVIKIQFPHIKDILLIDNFIKIMKAELVIRPVQNSFTSFYSLPTQLRLIETTQQNLTGNDITVINSDGSEEVQYGNLVVDNLYGESTDYLYDVTTYINNLLVSTGDQKNALLLSAPSPAFSNDLNRLIAADNSYGNKGIQLRLYYLTVAKN